MKKIIILLIILIWPSLAIAKERAEINCPDPNTILETTSEDEEKLIHALKELIPKVYGSNQKYREWKIELFKPMRNLTGNHKVYAEMATNFCGKEVANRSWFVRVRFPKLLPAESASLGEIYVVQDKQHRWSVWFQYH